MKLSNLIYSYISSTPFLEAYIERKIINYTALSKLIHDHLAKINKPVSESSILMALKRFSIPFEHKRKNLSFYISDISEVVVNSNLTAYRFKKSPVLKEIQIKLSERYEDEVFTYFLYKTSNSFTILLKSSENENEIIPHGAKILETVENLSVICLKFDNDEIRHPGLYYVLFKQFAWNNINIYETTSSGREISLLVKNEDVKNVFNLIQQEKIEPIL